MFGLSSSAGLWSRRFQPHSEPSLPIVVFHGVSRNLPLLASIQRYIGFDWDLEKKERCDPERKTRQNPDPSGCMAQSRCKILHERCMQSARKASSCFLCLSSHSPFLTRAIYLRRKFFLLATRTVDTFQGCYCRPPVGCGSAMSTSERDPPMLASSCRHWLVGRCQHFLWNRHHDRPLLGCVALGTRFPSRPRPGFRHWMGGGSRCRTRVSYGPAPKPSSVTKLP